MAKDLIQFSLQVVSIAAEHLTTGDVQETMLSLQVSMQRLSLSGRDQVFYLLSLPQRSNSDFYSRQKLWHQITLLHQWLLHQWLRKTSPQQIISCFVKSPTQLSSLFHAKRWDFSWRSIKFKAWDGRWENFGVDKGQNAGHTSLQGKGSLTCDFEVDLQELDNPELHAYFVKKLIIQALDGSNKQKELASTLLSAVYAKVAFPGPKLPMPCTPRKSLHIP